MMAVGVGQQENLQIAGADNKQKTIGAHLVKGSRRDTVNLTTDSHGNSLSLTRPINNHAVLFLNNRHVPPLLQHLKTDLGSLHPGWGTGTGCHSHAPAPRAAVEFWQDHHQTVQVQSTGIYSIGWHLNADVSGA